MTSFILAFACLSLLTVGVGLLPITIRKAWNRDSSLIVGPPRGWLYGETVWREYLRAMPAISIVGGPGIVIAGWSFLLLTSLNGSQLVANPLMRSALLVGAALGAVCAVVGIMLGILVVLFNWPSGLVMPSLRSERGAIGRQKGGR